MNTEYETAKNYVRTIEKQCELAEAALKALPGINSGPMGLTPDHIKQSPEYIAAKRTYKRAFNVLRDVNSNFLKRFAKEIKAERAAARLNRMK